MSRQTGLLNSSYTEEQRQPRQDKRVMFLKHTVTDRCRSVVEKFLSIDLEDQELDLQHFLKEELLPSAGGLLNRS